MQKQPEPLMQFNATFIPHTQHGTGDHLKPTHNARILSSNKKSPKATSRTTLPNVAGLCVQIAKNKLFVNAIWP